MSLYKTIVGSMGLCQQANEEIQQILITVIYVRDAGRMLLCKGQKSICAKLLMPVQDRPSLLCRQNAVSFAHPHAMRQKAVRIAQKIGHEKEKSRKNAAQLHGIEAFEAQR